jgi:hypothetical protein
LGKAWGELGSCTGHVREKMVNGGEKLVVSEKELRIKREKIVNYQLSIIN